MLKKSKLFAIAFLFAALDSYAMTQSEEAIALYKCEQASVQLSLNESLVRKAINWKNNSIKNQKMSNNDYMRQVSEENRAMREVMSGNGSYDKPKLLSWYNSDYCKNLLKEYQVFEYGVDVINNAQAIAKNKGIEDAVMRQILYYSKSMVKNNKSQCYKYKEQFDIAFTDNILTAKYRKDFLNGLSQTINDSSFKLKKFQVDYIKSQSSSNDFYKLASNIYQNCPNEGYLSEYIANVDSIKDAESLKSKSIIEKLSQLNLNNDRDCGNLSEVYCIANLREPALRSSYDISRKCDQQDNKQNECYLTAEKLYSLELKRMEIIKLNEERQKYESYIQNPSKSRSFNAGNSSSDIYILSEKCKQEAINLGLRGADYEKYKKEICIANAQSEFVKPQTIILEKIKNRLAEIQK